MPIRRSGTEKVYWKTQLPVDYIDTSLTINTYENVSADLSGGKPARLWWIQVEQTNNGATDEDITLEVTINGTAYEFSGTCVSGTVYFGIIGGNLTAGDFTPLLTTTNATTFGLNNAIGTPFIAESVGLIRVKQTTDVDAVSAQIEVNIRWEKLVGV